MEASVLFAVPAAMSTLLMGILYLITDEDVMQRRLIFLILSLMSMEVTMGIIGRYGSLTAVANWLMWVSGTLIFLLLMYYLVLLGGSMVHSVRGRKK